MRRILLSSFMTVLMLLVVSLNAQVTTSSMSGRVSAAGESLPGATVLVTHLPSGTSYGTATNTDGRYNLQGMRVGGPYEVKVSFTGYHTMVYNNINLRLGETYVLNPVLVEEATTLEAAEITAPSELSSDKTGASTKINTEQIVALPTITRQISDFTRLNPQSNGQGSFAGRDSRYNNFTVDGAAFNNNFGLSSGLPGGGTPISIDAIEEVAVNVSSFDIKQSGFTGANINAVTKSGTNNFKGTIYSFLRPKSFSGDHIGEEDIVGAHDAFNQLYGLSLGGPIIKDKLFFFINGEYEKEEYPSSDMAWTPSTDGVGDAEKHISRTTVADLERVKNHLIDKYGFDPGLYQDRGNFNTNSYRIIARLDWNINDNNKFTLRYNDVKTSSDMSTNYNSGPYNINRGSGRNSLKSIAFTNSNYNMNNIVRSITGQLNSRIGTNMANELLVSYTHIADKRSSPLDGTNYENMPFVDIWQDGDQYMSFGYELFTKNNAVINDVFNITDNYSFYLGNHTITAGLAYDFMYFKNSYLRYATGYYRYNSVDDFINGANPAAYSITYGLNGQEAPGVELNFGLGALYAQDEWSIADNFRLSYGLRLELPFYLNQIPENLSNYKQLEFRDGMHVDLSKWPKSKLLVSPRMGFNWDVNGDGNFIVRGGTGLFTGMLPFVWFTNQPTNANVVQKTIDYEGDMSKIKFGTDYHDILNNEELKEYFPMQSDSTNTLNQLCFVDPDFKLPQIWRTNLAFDLQLPWNMVLTLEGVFSKDINVVVQKNINEADPTCVIKTGAGDRDGWYTQNEDGAWVATRSNQRIQDGISNAMMLTNAKQGYQYSFTAQLDKRFSYGFTGLLAYTYSVSKDLTTNPGSAAASAWSSNVALNSLNDPGLAFSNFSVPNRVVGALTYSHDFRKAFGFSLSLYYSGAAQDRYSYTYSNDLNGDGNSSDLIYIPKDANDIVFVDMKDRDGNVLSTAADQAKALMDYIDNDKYLSAHKGEFAERFAAIGPWVNRFDAKALVNLFTNFGTNRRYTLQLSLDCKNIGNMFNSEWGVYKFHGLGSYNNIRLLTYKGMQSGKDSPTPTFTLNAKDVQNFNDNAKFSNNIVLSNAWQMLLGIRLIF